mgnify:CR=1 FL=1
MTEDEAKTKWCPHVRVETGHIEGPAVNRSDSDWPMGRCIGSACMAWRWDAEKCRQGQINHGYCGLAGKP